MHRKATPGIAPCPENLPPGLQAGARALYRAGIAYGGTMSNTEQEKKPDQDYQAQPSSSQAQQSGGERDEQKRDQPQAQAGEGQSEEGGTVHHLDEHRRSGARG